MVRDFEGVWVNEAAGFAVDEEALQCSAHKKAPSQLGVEKEKKYREVHPVVDVQGAGFAVDAQTREYFEKTDLEPGKIFS